MSVLLVAVAVVSGVFWCEVVFRWLRMTDGDRLPSTPEASAYGSPKASAYGLHRLVRTNVLVMSRGPGIRRSGSTLVMVLVVMLVVGLMTLQASQLLVAHYRGDRQQRLIEQTRELCELGAAKARFSLERDKAYSGEEFSVPVWDSTKVDGESFSSRTGTIRIEIVNSSGGIPAKICVTSRFPAGEPGEVVSTWEGK